jgi:DUF4097 and DUF4098 domain-containing protein YvlB
MTARKSLRRVLAPLCAGLLLSLVASGVAQTRDEVREEIHQTYAIAADGRISLNNINGSVHLSVWDRSEIKLDAIKTASSQERLDEMTVRIDSSPTDLIIKTVYAQKDNTRTREEGRRYDNPASVEYTLTVPRTVNINKVELINGDLDIDGIAGEVRASSINGRVGAKGLTGRVKLSTINGTLEATFDRVDPANAISLNSVNGSLSLTIPSDAEAELNASTVHGGISNEIGLPVKKGKHVGQSLAGLLGRGGSRIDLSNVNGSIHVQRANDGRRPSTVTNTLPPDDGSR